MSEIQSELGIEIRQYEVSKFNLTIFKKFLQKGLLLPIIPGIFLLGIGLLMGSIWPEFKGLLGDGGDFSSILESGFYQAIIPGCILEL